MRYPDQAKFLLTEMRREHRRVSRELRAARRENVRLRNSLVEFLTVAEASDLDGDWCCDWPRPPRLCALLARYIRNEQGWGADLERYKRARKALGLPWWGDLEYEDGLREPGGAQ